MWKIKVTALFILSSLWVTQNLGSPADSINSLVVNSTEPSSSKTSGKEGDLTGLDLNIPQIYQMHVKTNISNRFAQTTVVSKVKNMAEKAKEAVFSVILPEAAFISGFIMEVDGKNYTAYVEEKEEAKKTYDRALESGLGAAHVAVSARDSNRFTVSVNIEPETKAVFYLTYEELLKRQEGHYELVINLHPGQPVKDLNVEVAIAESRKITELKAPPIRSGNEIGGGSAELDPRANIEVVNDTSAIIKFTPNVERQKQIAHLLGRDEKTGLAGQFVVQYDVERDPKGGEVLIQDGYFVHFFAPTDLEPLPKHVVFVLDTSSSMYGQKIQQLKEAMHKILEQLNENDLLHIVEFNSIVDVWDLNNPDATVSYPDYTHREVNYNLDKYNFPAAFAANADNIKKAKSTVSKFTDRGSTDIHNALKIGLHLVEVTKQLDNGSIRHQPIIVFLTDGEPTTGITYPDKIMSRITEFNSGVRKAPIFALSFGDGADKKFLQKLALRNSGFSKHIYEASDAALQLQDFYRQISSPLLANVTFKYEPSVTSLTKTEFPIHFKGSELVVTGCFSDYRNMIPVVEAQNGPGLVSFQPIVQQSLSNVERLWAYLTVKQLLEKKETSDEDQIGLKKKALDLALKYSFVTHVSSLVVVKPNATNAVDTEAAEKRPHLPTFYNAGGAGYSSGGSAYSGRQYISTYPGSYAAVASYPTAPRGESGIPLSGFRGTKGDYGDSHIYSGIPSSGFRGTKGDYGHSHIYHRPTYNIVHPSNPKSTQSPVTTEAPQLLTTLPWLKTILNENGILSLPTGNYKLGLNETLSDSVACPKTPAGGTGHCSLLNSCPQVHSILTSVDIFVQHFCTLQNQYAGVCCPDSS